MVARPAYRYFKPVRAALAFGLLFATSACFDSDEVPRAAEVTTTGVVDPTTTTGPESTSTGLDPTTGEPDVSCRDAVGCIQQCSLDLITDPGIEPDLGCFLDCEEQLTVREAYHLLRLANCAAAECEMQDACMPGGNGGSTGGSGSSSGGADDGGGGDGGLIDPCLFCVFGLMTQTEPQVCVEFHELCNEE